MSEKSQNVQDVFLNNVRKNKTPVTVFLVNGVKLQGIITWFDNFCVLLRRDAHSQLVYKHAISTVMPAAPIQLFEPEKRAKKPDGMTAGESGDRASVGRCLVVHPVLKRDVGARRRVRAFARRRGWTRRSAWRWRSRSTSSMPISPGYRPGIPRRCWLRARSRISAASSRKRTSAWR